MAIARSQVSTAIPGKEMEFISLSKEGIKLMNDKGIPTGVRVSHSGTQDIEVYTVSMFDNYSDYGAAQEKLISDPELQAWYAKTVASGSGRIIDTMEMVEMKGFEKGAGLIGNVTVIVMYKLIQDQGNMGKFVQSCQTAKEFQEKHGAQVRLWQVNASQRYTGMMAYSMGFENFDDMGKAFDGWKEENEKFYFKQPVTATMEQQIIMRSSTMIG